MNSNDSLETVPKDWGGGGDCGSGFALRPSLRNGVDDGVRSRCSGGLWEGDEVGRIILAWNLGQGGRPAAVVVAVGLAVQPIEADLYVGAIRAAMMTPKEAGQPDDGRMVAVAT